MLTGIGLKISAAFTAAERMTRTSDNLSCGESCQAVPGSRMITAFPGGLRRKTDERCKLTCFSLRITVAEASVGHGMLSPSVGQWTIHCSWLIEVCVCMHIYIYAYLRGVISVWNYYTQARLVGELQLGCVCLRRGKSFPIKESRDSASPCVSVGAGWSYTGGTAGKTSLCCFT